MTEKKVADAVLQKITKEHIEPKSVWHFRLKNAALWAGTVTFVVVGALALSVLLFMLYNGPWHLLGEAGHGFAVYVQHMLSIVWILVFVVVIVIAEIVLRRTKKGYKYSLISIVGVLIGVSVIASLIFHTFDIGKSVDTKIGKHAPFYKTMEHRRDKLMYNPAKGTIIGNIVEVNDMTFILVNRREAAEWTVHYKDASLEFVDMITAGRMVFVKGAQLDDKSFEAVHVFDAEKLRQKAKDEFGKRPPPPNERKKFLERNTK